VGIPNLSGNEIPLDIFRRHAEAVAVRNLERLSLALDVSGFSLWDYESATGKVFLSQEWSVMLGGEPLETRSTLSELLELAHPDDREKWRCWAKDAISANIPSSRIELRVRNLAGDWIWIETTAKVAERDHDGRARRIIGTNCDISERKHIEETLRKFQQEQQIILDSVPAMVWFKDTENRILKINRRAADALGMPIDKIEGQSTYDLYPEEAAKYHADDLEVIRSGVPKLGIEELVHPKGGEIRWVQTDKIPYRDSEGEVAGVVVFAVDITERKRAEESLRRSEADYRSLVEGATFGIYRSTPEGKFVAVNAALVLMLGYESASDLMSVDIATDIYVDSHARDRLMLHKGTRESPRSAEVEWKRKNGQRITVRLTWRKLQGEQGEPICFEGIAEDVTDRLKLESQLRQSQKMEAVGQLAGGIAHDFNNLLTVIRGYIGLLGDRFGEDDPGRDYLSNVLQATDRAGSLTQQLLAFSRKQVMSPKVLDLNSFVAETSMMLPRLLRENIKITVSTCDNGSRVHVDPGQLSQVIVNLAVNASDAMPRGGELVIQTGTQEINELYRGIVPPGRYAVLIVRDSGAGIDSGTQSRIFEPFFTTKEPGKGTGLGLSTVYGIVRQSDGYIVLDSKVGEGTTFTVYIPTAQGEAEIIAPEKPTRQGPPKGSETILLAEDESGVREVARRFMEMQGYTVLEADGPLQAIQLAEARTQRIDLLVSDVVMPTMSGPELAQRVAVSHPEIKVLYISGYTHDAIAQHGVLQSGVFLLQKPFTRDSLATTVRKVLDSN
jgi:PAS domain S-box-containing protein